MIYPLLPFLVVGILAAPPVVLGVVEGVAEAVAGITKYVAGRWSDRRGRKPFIASGYGLAALGKVLVASATVWPTVLLGRSVDRFGKGIRGAPRDALIAQSVPREDLGKAFGFHRAGDTLGAVIGPLIALLALTILNGDIRAALWWAVIPAVLSVGLTLAIRERRRTATGAVPSAPKPQRRLAVRKSPLPASFWRVTGVLAMIALINFPDALLLLRAADLGMSPTTVVLVYVVFNLVYTVTSFPAGLLADRWHPALVYALGLLAFGTAYLGLGLTESHALAWLFLGLYGLFPGMTDGVGKAWISRVSHEELRGRAQGVYQALINASILCAGLWAGLLWNSGSGRGTTPLIVSGVLGLAAAVGLGAVGVQRTRRG